MKKKEWLIGIIAGCLIGLLGVVSGIIPRYFTQSEKVYAAGDATEVLELMLQSHTLWSSVQGKASVVWYSEGEKEIWESNFSIEQPKLAYFETWKSGEVENKQTWLNQPDGIFVADFGKGVYSVMEPISEKGFGLEIEHLPTTLASAEVGTIYRHPLGGRIPSVLGDYLYPTGLAQRSGDYTFLGEDEILNRSVYILAYQLKNEIGELTSKAQYWVDVETGAILKALSFGGKDMGELLSEVTITSLNFNSPLEANIFTFDPQGLEQISLDEYYSSADNQ
ncbi:MAG: hypothetical protein Fur0022_33440 [Anaerolineales bacterium]